MLRHRILFTLFFLTSLLFAASDPRIPELDYKVKKLQSDLDDLKANVRVWSNRSYINFNYRFYINTGITFVMPRAQTIPFNTDNGIGAYLGVGQYLGSHHVLDLTLEWDLYPALSLKYRYEFRLEHPQFTWSPVIGYKVKLASLPPFDNYLATPADVKSAFFVIGAEFGFPLQSSLINLDILYLINGQQFILVNAGIHFFL